MPIDPPQALNSNSTTNVSTRYSSFQLDKSHLHILSAPLHLYIAIGIKKRTNLNGNQPPHQ